MFPADPRAPPVYRIPMAAFAFWLPRMPFERPCGSLEGKIHHDHWTSQRQVLHHGAAALLEGQIAIGD
jgi:hypothetical protein